MAQHQANLDTYNKTHPVQQDKQGRPVKDSYRTQQQNAINADKQGVQKIEDLVSTFNSYSKLTGAKIDNSAKATIDDAGTERGQKESQGQQQYDSLVNFSAGAATGEFAVESAAGGVAGKAAGLGLKAAAPYLSKVFAAFASTATKEGTTLYRVWGDGAGASGRSWTTVDPRTVSNFRDAAGLPSQNSGRFLSTGTLKNAEGVTSRGALPLEGNAGGLPETVVPNPESQIQLQNVQGLNPEF